MVKNEEKYLEKSLESLKPLFHGLRTELIIVDTGSEDNTVEIAKRYTNKVYFHEWNNNFGEMRNRTIKYATGEWILVLDGDEVLENASNLKKFLNSSISNRYNTGMITIKSITREDIEDMSGLVDMLRLFRNTKSFRYEGVIHEQPQYKGPVFNTNTIVLHYGYLATDKNLMELKFKRNTSILEKELEKDPENIYYWFQLSQSYCMYKDYKKALEMNTKAYSIAKTNNIDLKERMYIYTHLVRLYYLNKKYEEAERTALEAIDVEDGYIDIYYYLGKSQENLKKNDNAIESYEKYLEILNQYKKTGVAKGSSISKSTVELYEDVYLSLSLLYKRNEDREKALEYALKVTKDYMQESKVPHLVELYVDLGRYEELKEEYMKAANNLEIQEKYRISLENVMAKMEEDKKYKLIELFSRGNCSYSLLNKIRMYIKEDMNVEKKVEDEIKALKFESLPVFYADIIYFLLDKKMPITSILQNLREYDFLKYINYLTHKYNNFGEVILKYLDNISEEKSLTEVKLRKVLCKVALNLSQLDIERFKNLWDTYIENGTYYIAEVYNRRIIENEMIYDVKDSEDAFLLYMFLAMENKDKDELSYIRYLRKALKVYPNMKKGIELILKEIEKESSQNSPAASNSSIQNELEELKKGVKKNIHMLLKANRITEARALVNEYLKIVPGDIEMQKLKEELQLQLM